MNARNDFNEIQPVLPGMPEPEHEWFDRATQADVDAELRCYECEELLELDAPYTKITVFDSPFTNGKEIVLHVNNDNDCLDKLEDTSWADFRYFTCNDCGRMVCRQSPYNGWHSWVRVREDGSEVCLKCFEDDVLENGIPRESFEGGKISGSDFSVEDLRENGYKEVDDFEGVHITGGPSAKRFCDKALGLMDQGKIIVTRYDHMAIGMIEGYVSMWAKEGLC